MSKVHLLASDEPLIEGADLTAVCGQLVAKASFVMMQDTEAMTTPMDWGTFRNGCYRCLKVPLVGRRVYCGDERARSNDRIRLTEESVWQPEALILK